MGQSPLAATVARKLTSSASAPLYLDGTGKSALVAIGGSQSALNVTAAALIFAGPVRLCKIVILAPGSTSGAFTFNDIDTLAGAAAGNAFFSIAYNAANNVAGAVFNVDWPCAKGLVLSAVPGGGSPILAISYTA